MNVKIKRVSRKKRVSFIVNCAATGNPVTLASFATESDACQWAGDQGHRVEGVQ